MFLPKKLHLYIFLFKSFKLLERSIILILNNNYKVSVEDWSAVTWNGLNLYMEREKTSS